MSDNPRLKHAKRKSKMEIPPSASFPRRRESISALARCAPSWAAAQPASAQVITGTPPYGRLTVNNASLNVHLSVPAVGYKAGRGFSSRTR